MKNTLSLIGITLTTILCSCVEPTIASEKITLTETPTDTVIVSNPINTDGTTVKSRFNTPDGFTRVDSENGSFGSYLQSLPLKPDGTLVYHYDGSVKLNTSSYCAVVDLPLRGNEDHQCADAVMRLGAEFLFSQKRYDEIYFSYVGGGGLSYITYLSGKTPTTENLWSYLKVVFKRASTLSLDKQLKSKLPKDLEIGDVFVKGGAPGHALIVVDKCVDKNGQVKFMLAQSYMPAQDIQILVGDNESTPWYNLDFGDYLYSAEWTFTKDQLKSF